MLAGATALFVARTLVPGDDPGLLGEHPHAAGLWLNQLWLAMAAVWAAWRLSSRDVYWYVGAAELLLAAAVACVFVGAGLAARYRHPAWIIAGDWLGLLAAFVVVRQLAAGGEEQAGLFAALQATGAALAVHAVALRLGIFPVASVASPGVDSFAGDLTLLLPLMVGGVVAARRTTRPWPVATATLFLTFGVVALWLTGSEAAVGGVVIVGTVTGAFALWRMPARRAAGVLAIAVVLSALAGCAAYSSGWLKEEVGRFAYKAGVLREGWRVTGRILAAAGPRGVGPGNFARVYPYFMGPSGEQLAAPRNFVLELLVSAGPGLLIAVLAALVVFFAGTAWRLRGGRAAELAPRNSPASTRWEYYAGGMLGLTLGSVPRLSGAGSAVPAAGAAAALESAAWFAAFALYERLSTSGRDRACALAAGVGALLLDLCAADGISIPAVAGLLWPAVALGINSSGARPAAWLSRAAPARVLALPALLAAALLYFFIAAYPVTVAQIAARRAEANGKYFLEQVAVDPGEWDASASYAAVATQVIAPFERAARADPEDARYKVALAHWYGRLWGIHPARDPNNLTWDKADQFAEAAARLDPDGLEPPRTKVLLLRLFAAVVEDQARAARKRKDEVNEKKLLGAAREQHRLAANLLTKVVERVPNDAGLREMLAAEWFAAGDARAGRRQAAEARRLDLAATAPARRLTDRQRQRVETWLAPARTAGHLPAPPRPVTIIRAPPA